MNTDIFESLKTACKQANTKQLRELHSKIVAILAKHNRTDNDILDIVEGELYKRDDMLHFLVDSGYYEYADSLLLSGQELADIPQTMQGEYLAWVQKEYK